MVDSNNERYREGQRDAKMSELSRRISAVEDRESRCKTGIYSDIDDLRKEINAVKISVAKMAGVFSLIGGLTGGAIASLVMRAVGG
jgi:hypothetical protein